MMASTTPSQLIQSLRSHSMQRTLVLFSSLLFATLAWSSEESETPWEVSNPPGPWKEITIDTETTTWSFVDVSPDGQTVVFDMLGDIYSMPLEGGPATALTAGIEWNFQPVFSPDGQRIAFISDRDSNDNIWIMNRDGSDDCHCPKTRRLPAKDMVHTSSARVIPT